MRLDKYLVENGFVKSRQNAVELIKNGKVFCDGVVILKNSFDVDDGVAVTVNAEPFPYVGRGALKLVHALEVFGVSPDEKVCVDIGASTGGFTDVLLQRGALKVCAVDSGHGQLDERIRNDPRVVNLEGVNARNIAPDSLGSTVDLAVCDVSFISQTLIHPAVYTVLNNSGEFIGLVKPQFELSRNEISKGGIVKNVRDRYTAAQRVYLSLCNNGFSVRGFCASPITGGDGNIEYLIYAVKNDSDPSVSLIDVERIVYDERRDTSAQG